MNNTIDKKLSRMRGQLTRWIMVHGLGRWLLAGLGILVVDMALDRLFKMDFAQRLVMLVVMILAIGLFFLWRVLRPLTRRATDAALIYEVERRHPELNESVLSSYQLSRQADLVAAGMSPELAQNTIDQGLQRAASINFGDALDLKQNQWNWMLLLAGLLLTGGLAVGIGQTEFLSTWFNRNVLLLDDQWPQGTYLEIAGVRDGKLVVSRGADHRQLVLVTEASTVKDVSVSLEVENPGGRSILPMKPTGKLDGREYLFTFHNVSSPFRFRASGGDAVTDWVTVELVEPPSISQMELTVDLPQYTGQTEPQRLEGIGPHAVLDGSRLNVAIETNKPLSEAVLRIGDERVSLTPGDSPTKFSIRLPQSGQLKGGDYQFELTDSTGVPGNRKSKFKVTIADDKSPQVRASLLGISGLVVPRALIPTAYQAVDEYGITRVAFDCHWKIGEDEQQQEKSEQVLIATAGRPGVLQEPTASLDADGVLELEKLKVEPGTSFRFSLIAADNYPDPPNVGRSQEFLLRVVTPEELRADLLRREIEQREAFDQAYQKQLALATELEAIGLRKRPADVTIEDFHNQREADLITAVREQKSVGTAIARIADRFEDFLVEVKNNRLDEAENEIAPDQRIEKRFDEKIIQPIRQLDGTLISMASRQMDSCRIAAGDDQQLAASIAATETLHQQILEAMKEILAAMNDSENFQGIINDILEIKRDTESMKKKINEEQGKEDDIFDDQGIFDK